MGQNGSDKYRETFFNANPSLKGKQMVIHHAIEQQVLTKYPNVFRRDEINSLENLRGIPSPSTTRSI